MSNYVARNAWVPVLLIPNRVNYKTPTNIAFATDNRRISEVALKQLSEWTKQFEAFTHLVNVHLEKTTSYKIRNAQIRKFKDMSNFAYKSVIIESDSIEYGLNQYVENNDIDLLAMVTAHRSLIEELLFKSTTKEMVINTEIPLLIMHYED
ncbi:MAG: universal stress protein [Saprospiraceae bacterium]|nr:universal stress protein [Saprospiraceae bacterium]